MPKGIYKRPIGYIPKSAFQKGHIPYFSDIHRAKISFSKMGEKNPMFGTKHSEQWKKNLSERISGEKHPNWKGGISTLLGKIRTSLQYREWRRKVLARDYYQCIWCYSKKHLEVDHIVTFNLIFTCLKIRFGIENLYNKIVNSELFNNTENGRTLCRDCHKFITFHPYATTGYYLVETL